MRAVLGASITASAAAASLPARAELTPPPIPELEEGAGIIKNKQLAIALGKALFWDQDAGSDGVACATCHFSAGADSRLKNQLSPGLLDQVYAGGDIEFGSNYSDNPDAALGTMPSGNRADSNYTLLKQDFPLHRLSDYKNRNSPIVSTTNDVVSSMGAYSAQFHRIGMCGGSEDICGRADSSIFHAGRYAARQVEPRNTPTTINAGFFYSNFWDGRANNLFNGVDVFGLRTINGNPDKRLVVLHGNQPVLDYLQIRNASLASQAVGPALSEIEMSCRGREFVDLAEKLLDAVPLSGQQVSPNDSVLGPFTRPSFGKIILMLPPVPRGLHPQYRYSTLIQQAFDKKFWGANGRYRVQNGQLIQDRFRGHSQMELNFSMFWGLAIMMYERSLISDQSRFDSWYASCRPNVTNTSGQTNQAPFGNPTVTCFPATNSANTSTDPTAHGFSAQEVLGFGLFMNAGTGGNGRGAGNPACVSCHGPVGTFTALTRDNPVVTPIMSEAAFTALSASFNPVERSRVDGMGDNLPPLPNGDYRRGAVHDRGFFNIGVTPTSHDLGNGGLDPYGNPLSLARMFLGEQAGMTVTDPPKVVLQGVEGTTGPLFTSINRCASPGIIEPGGTPAFAGCTGSPIPDPLLLDPASEREMVDGTFKTPSLRNVGLTAPYFHSGNYADLRSVVEFYARGGSQRAKALESEGFTGDTSGTGPLGKGISEDGPDFGTNVDFFIRDLKSTDEQIDALVAFMLTLSDQRVQCDMAPFDHPALAIPIGHTEADRFPRDGRADTVTALLPAVGSQGYAPNSGYCIPNKGDLFAPGMQGRIGGARVPLK